jgi:hypothetical protein
MIKIDFEFETQYGTFRDALYLPEDSSHTEEQITEMKTERLNNWLFAVENPPTPEYVEVDDITYEQVEIDSQVDLKPVES